MATRATITQINSLSVPALATSSVAELPVTVDTQSRVRTSKEQRRVTLGEFARSGLPAHLAQLSHDLAVFRFFRVQVIE